MRLPWIGASRFTLSLLEMRLLIGNNPHNAALLINVHRFIAMPTMELNMIQT
jgi:hypothetical protein